MPGGMQTHARNVRLPLPEVEVTILTAEPEQNKPGDDLTEADGGA